jgi:hypothetical protein
MKVYEYNRRWMFGEAHLRGHGAYSGRGMNEEFLAHLLAQLNLLIQVKGIGPFSYTCS